jgi:hypothetical protein
MPQSTVGVGDNGEENLTQAALSARRLAGY